MFAPGRSPRLLPLHRARSMTHTPPPVSCSCAAGNRAVLRRPRTRHFTKDRLRRIGSPADRERHADPPGPRRSPVSSLANANCVMLPASIISGCRTACLYPSRGRIPGSPST
jgi:hypothetical protein